MKAACLGLGICHVPALDNTVFRAARGVLGGRVRVLLSGGAPMARHKEHFLKLTMGCAFAQVCTALLVPTVCAPHRRVCITVSHICVTFRPRVYTCLCICVCMTCLA